MSYAAPIARVPARRRSPLRTAASVATTGLCVGVLLVLLEAAVAEPEHPHGTGARGAGAADRPYGGQLDHPDPRDVIDPGGLMGLGLLALGLLNGLVFAGAAALDGVRAPSAAETRRRLRHRSAPGVVPGGRREVACSVVAPAATPTASHAPAIHDVPARRSAPGRPALGTTYAPIPAPRPPEHERVPERAPTTIPRAVSAPASTPGPRRPSPVPRDRGGVSPVPATRRGTGPWGWRPARPDPVPWRNPWPAVPVMVGGAA